MIRINLVPEKAGARPAAAPTRVRSEDAVSPLTYLIVVAIFAALGGYYYFFVHTRLANKRIEETDETQKLVAIEAEIKGLRAGAKELQDAESISRSMLNIVYAIDSEDRVLWAEKFNQISDLVPESVYVKRITVSEQIAKVETAESKERRADWQAQQKGKAKKATPAGPQPVPIYFPQITQEMKIYGLTYSENEAERIRLINDFHDNLMSGVNKDLKADFMKGLVGPIAYGDVLPSIIGGRAVAEFSFSLKTRPTAPRLTAKAKPAATAESVEKAASEKERKPSGGSKTRRESDVQ